MTTELGQLPSNCAQWIACFAFALSLLWPISANSLTSARFTGGATFSFPAGSASLSKAQEEALGRHVTRIRAFDLIVVIIKANGDKPESDNKESAQFSLAFARASAIRQFLRDAGIEDHRIYVDLRALSYRDIASPRSDSPKPGEVEWEYIGENCKQGLIVVCEREP